MQQVAKGAKDSLTEVIRSGDLIAYTAEEGVRWLGEVQPLPLLCASNPHRPCIVLAESFICACADAGLCALWCRASCS